LKITAVIMAAGNSKRMGENKLLLKLKNTELIRHFLNNFPSSLFHKSVLVYADDIVGKIASEYGIGTIKNTCGGAKNTTIKLGTEACSDSDGMMFFTADQPFTEIETIKSLIDNFDNNIVIPVCDGKRRNPVLFPHSTYSDLSSLSGDRGGRDVIDKHPDIVKEIYVVNENQFIDIDTKEDAKYAESLF